MPSRKTKPRIKEREEKWAIEYTYPQLPIQTAATRPGSILNRQGGSIFNRRRHRARQLLALHRQTYRTFWKWSDGAVDEAILGGRLWSSFGWQIFTSSQPNDRSLRNFPMQANGAEMLRIASIKLVAAGIRVCAPVHDALLVEAPLDQLDAVVQMTQDLMKEASRIVLDGFELGSDAKVIRYPERYMDKRGTKMWNMVMGLIGEPGYAQPPSA